MKILICKKRQ